MKVVSCLHSFIQHDAATKATSNSRITIFLLLSSSSLYQFCSLLPVPAQSESTISTRPLPSQLSSLTRNRTMMVHTNTPTKPAMASALMKKATSRTRASRMARSKLLKDTTAIPAQTVTQSPSTTPLMRTVSKPRGEFLCFFF